MTTEGTQPKTPNNLTGYLFPEALVRQFLAYQFSLITKTIDDPSVTFIEELFHKAGLDVVKQVKTWWRDNTNIPVTLNYSRADDVGLPFVNVVNGGEREKTEEAFMDDYGGRATYGVSVMGGDDPTRGLYTRSLRSVPVSHTVKVFVVAQDPNLATYIYHVIWALLLVNKDDFDKYGGMRSLSLQGSDVEHHPELYPEFAYFKVITLTFDSQFDVPLAKTGTIGGVSVTLSTFLADGDTAEDVKAGG